MKHNQLSLIGGDLSGLLLPQKDLVTPQKGSLVMVEQAAMEASTTVTPDRASGTLP